MPNKFKGVIESVHYSTDYVYPDGDAAATKVEIPVAQIIQDGADMPAEEAATGLNLNGQNLQAGVSNTFVLPVILDDDDTFMAALKTASSNHTPVWFKFKMLGQSARWVGGRLGCQVTVAEGQAAQFGSFVVTLLGGMTTGADADDTFEIVAGS